MMKDSMEINVSSLVKSLDFINESRDAHQLFIDSIEKFYYTEDTPFCNTSCIAYTGDICPFKKDENR